MSEPANERLGAAVEQNAKNAAPKMNALAACKTLATSARPVRDSDACGRRVGTLDGLINFTVDRGESKHQVLAKLRRWGRCP